MFLFGDLYSMTLASVGPQSLPSEITDHEHVYDTTHPRRGHLALINNRYFDRATGKSERRGSDVDAANLFSTFKQLGFEVDLKSNLTCQDMLRMAIDCKLLFSIYTQTLLLRCHWCVALLYIE